MRLLCLPIDSRPCNTQFIREMTAWAGWECILPHAYEMDDFRHPAPFEETCRFLLRELPRCGAAVISLDHWCYGSLLASREETVSPDEARNRVEILKNMLKKHPGVPVYMSTVILRSSISTLTLADLDAYQAMTDYSVAADRFARFGLAEDEQAMLTAKARMPDGLLDKTLRVRQRNLEVNRTAVELAKEGIVSSLSILQEDCQVYGLPRKDQRAILEKIAETGARNVFLRNGTDEAGAVSAAAALSAGREPLSAELRFLGDGDFIAPYEDRPFRENLKNACMEIGIEEQPGSETVILVLCPENGEQEESLVPVSPMWLQRCAEEADKCIQQGKRVYLLDVLRANGGAKGLLSAMQNPDGLWGYSAWNTASNAMGTLLAQAVTDAIRGQPNKRYFQERILDDYVYQTVLRGELEEALTGRGEDVYSLRDKKAAEETLRTLYRQRLPELWPLKNVPDYRVALPWSRTFEVLAEADASEEQK